MSSLWGSKPKNSGIQADGDHAHTNEDGHPSPHTREEEHDDPDERTRLLPAGAHGYLDPDDPAVSE